MLTKIKISIVLFVLASLISTGFLVTQINGHESGNEINYLYADLSINATDDRELVGFADNVFIAGCLKTKDSTKNKLNLSFKLESKAGNL